MELKWKWFWRALGVLGAITMVVKLAEAWASLRAVKVEPVAKGQALPDGLDIIAIQLDILSLIIAVASIGLGLAGFIGYQSIKSAAISKADEVATNAMAAINAKKDGDEGLSGVNQPATFDLASVIEVERKEDGDERNS